MKITEFPTLSFQFLQAMRMKNYSDRSVKGWEYDINRFIAWCKERGIERADEVTPDHVGAYRRWLFHYRSPKTKRPLCFDTQRHYLTSVRIWFWWLKQNQHLDTNPAIGIDLPKEEKRLPVDILTADEVETLLNAADITTPLGIRDRAIMETFYSTGIRCSELVNLDIYDVCTDRGTVTVRQGKNKQDRIAPIGKRALSWLEKWQQDVRPDLTLRSSDNGLFVSTRGKRLNREFVSAMVRRYMLLAEITKPGACHLLRHTAATLMMENGADLRSLQMFLGHKKLNTTQLYTHVSIQRLKDVHDKTHPAKPNAVNRQPED